METLIDDPGLVKDIFDFWADFVIETARDLVTQCKIDFVHLMEDGMAYKNSTLVSPQTYLELWIPGMRRVTPAPGTRMIRAAPQLSIGNRT